MTFVTQRHIKNPRKSFKCSMCGKPLKEHHYTAYYNDNGGVSELREHSECKMKREAMCRACSYNNDCTCSIEECFNEIVINKGEL